MTRLPQALMTTIHRLTPRGRVILSAVLASILVVAVATVGVSRERITVTVTVDGVTRPVTTWDRHAGAVLDAANIEVGGHDEIQPGVSARLNDGDTVEVRHARAYPVTVDGEQRTVWSAAADASQIVEAIRSRAQSSDVTISTSRSATRSALMTLASDGTSIVVNADGKNTPVNATSAMGITDALDAAKVTASPIDQVKVRVAADGRVNVDVVRVTRGDVTSTQTIAHDTVREETDELPQGKEEVTTKGVDGVETITRYRQVEGERVLVDVEVSREVTTKPVTEVVRVGTADPEEWAAKQMAEGNVDALRNYSGPMPVYSGSDPRTIAQQKVLARGWGSGEYQCLETLWQRESGWNPYAANPSSGAYGIPQALPGSKMASAGSDWQTNPATQIEWGLGYIAGRYGTPCGALGHSNSVGWY